MVIILSQILIFICVIFFIVFNLIAIHLYKETYSRKIIPVAHPDVFWAVITDISNYKNWWSKFEDISNIQTFITVKEKIDGSTFKIYINNVSPNFAEELWTFITESNGNNHEIIIKKESLTPSKFKNFINKYYKNSRDIKTFVKEFNNEQLFIKYLDKEKQ